METKEYIENSNSYYNLTTGAYQLYFGEHLHLSLWCKRETRNQAIKRTNDMFFKHGNLNSNSEVIDLGCGIGSLSLLIAKKYGCNITAIYAANKIIEN